MPYSDAQAELDFIANPIAFMRNHIVRPVLYDGPSRMPNRVSRLSLTKDDSVSVKRGSYHWYQRNAGFYKLTTDPAGNVFAYVLGFHENNAVGTCLGTGPTSNIDPALMITYRMDGCTLGFAQNPGAPAYVSHHNDKAGSNTPATLTAQNITWNPTAAPAIAPALNFMHKDTYMSDSTNSINAQYKATVFGVRGAHGTWDFYYQARKRQGTLADAKWTLKGVTQI